MVYLIADTHFGHHNIIEYEERPFKSVKEMDEIMIERWNKTVNKNDIVYHLGDFFLCSTDRQFEVFNQLNGEIVLIRGNHDQQSRHKLLNRIGFKEVYSPYTKLDKFYLSHRPMFDKLKSDYYNIHGHQHGLTYKNSKSDKSDKHICVSVELIDYKPISMGDLKI